MVKNYCQGRLAKIKLTILIQEMNKICYLQEKIQNLFKSSLITENLENKYNNHLIVTTIIIATVILIEIMQIILYLVMHKILLKITVIAKEIKQINYNSISSNLLILQ